MTIVNIYTRQGVVKALAFVADTPASREIGLSQCRSSLSTDLGMLFVMESPRRSLFTMRDTAIPLDIIFIGLNNRITNIEKADPYSQQPYVANDYGIYILEMNQGWCARNSVAPGDEVTYG